MKTALFASALALCPDTSTETCYRGGMTSNICTLGMTCPPCWIPQNGKWGCYEKAMGPDNSPACPPWSGIVDITNPPASCSKPTDLPTKPTDPPIKPPIICPDVAEDTCFRGSHLEYPCKGKDCPPCWEYKNKRWDCYDPINGKCEWENLVDIRSMPANCQLPECD